MATTPHASNDLDSEIAALADLLEPQSGQPFCTGTVHLNKNVSTLFYKNDSQIYAGALDFSSATEDDLLKLANACEPATFGVGRKDVLDESYRKAWKMDNKDFMAQLQLDETNIMDYVADGLVPTTNVNKRKPIHAELYKLNVYAPGSFFKAHVDTPRSKEMVGSLVLIFPTSHEGGSLVFRKGGKEWSFDSAKEVSVENQNLVWVAFYSDLEHEVTPITSGYRVTITYNIYYSKAKGYYSSTPLKEVPGLKTSSVLAAAKLSQQIQDRFSTLLLDPGFMPQGGLIGLGLHHMYPMDPLQGWMSNYLKLLKGQDVVLLHALRDLKLKPILTVLYRDEDNHKRFYPSTEIYDDFHKLDSGELGSSLVEWGNFPVHKVTHPDADYCWDNDEDITYQGSSGDKVPSRRLVCLNDLAERNSFHTAIDKYGNDGGVIIYGHFCLVVKVGPFGERDTGHLNMKNRWTGEEEE